MRIEPLLHTLVTLGTEVILGHRTAEARHQGLQNEFASGKHIAAQRAALPVEGQAPFRHPRCCAAVIGRAAAETEHIAVLATFHLSGAQLRNDRIALAYHYLVIGDLRTGLQQTVAARQPPGQIQTQRLAAHIPK